LERKHAENPKGLFGNRYNSSRDLFFRSVDARFKLFIKYKNHHRHKLYSDDSPIRIRPEYLTRSSRSHDHNKHLPLHIYIYNNNNHCNYHCRLSILLLLHENINYSTHRGRSGFYGGAWEDCGAADLWRDNGAVFGDEHVVRISELVNQCVPRGIVDRRWRFRQMAFVVVHSLLPATVRRCSGVNYRHARTTASDIIVVSSHSTAADAWKSKRICQSD